MSGALPGNSEEAEGAGWVGSEGVAEICAGLSGRWAGSDCGCETVGVGAVAETVHAWKKKKKKPGVLGIEVGLGIDW